MIEPSEHSTNGFEIVPAVLDQHDLADVAALLEEATLERSRAGARHLMRHPTGRSILVPSEDRKETS